jgi:hypothetical protein
VGLVYDHRELPEVTTIRPEVAGVLQIYPKLTQEWPKKHGSVTSNESE